MVGPFSAGPGGGEVGVIFFSGSSLYPAAILNYSHNSPLRNQGLGIR